MQVRVPLVSRSRPCGASIWTEGAIPPDKVDNPLDAPIWADRGMIGCAVLVIERAPVMSGANPARLRMIPPHADFTTLDS